MSGISCINIKLFPQLNCGDGGERGNMFQFYFGCMFKIESVLLAKILYSKEAQSQCVGLPGIAAAAEKN